MTLSHENKEKIQYSIAIIAFFLGVSMCIADFVVDPLAQMHDTSLWFLGQMITFCAAVFGISLHYSGELNNFKQEIRTKISNDENVE